MEISRLVPSVFLKGIVSDADGPLSDINQIGAALSTANGRQKMHIAGFRHLFSHALARCSSVYHNGNVWTNAILVIGTESRSKTRKTRVKLRHQLANVGSVYLNLLPAIREIPHQGWDPYDGHDLAP